MESQTIPNKFNPTPDLEQFFLIKKNFIDDETCQKLISKYKEDIEHSSIDVRKVSGVDKIINELYLDDPKVKSKWESEVESLKISTDIQVKEYLKRFKTVSLEDYFFSHAVFWEQHEHKYAPFHYDAEFVIEPESEDPIRNFLCLLYLNDDYEGGEVMFPLQGKVVKPEKGMLIIFPTSFMFPHMTTPSIGDDRFLMRLTYYFDKTRKVKDEGY
jgi:hypothetical protein